MIARHPGVHDRPAFWPAIWCWLALAVPLVAIGLWAQRAGLGFPRAWANWDVVTGLVVAGLAVLIARRRLAGRLSWPLAWIVYLAALVLALSEAISFYFQASTFNARFFANLRLESLGTSLHAFPLLFGGAVAVLVVVLVLAAWGLRALARLPAAAPVRRAREAAVPLALLVAALLLPSPWQRLGRFVVQYQRSNTFADRAAPAQLRGLADPDPVPRDQVRAAAGRNLVIIYMESLERIYTDERIFPGLTPNLNRWRAQGLDYTDYLTFTGADYTIAGLFASQCGVPYLPSPVRALELGGNNANASSFQPDLACLGDVLHAAGYEQVFMNGVDLSFADDGTFFRLHGFDQVLGLKQLESADGNRLPQPGWGLYDRDLFRLAARIFAKLAASGRPFNLDVLTIDNHPPHGRPSPGCPAYAANPNDTLQSVHCTDYLVGKFLDTIRDNPAWKNTVVVVMSDHQSLRNDAWPLYPKSYKRRPLLFILNAGQGRRDMRFYHMDIAPTVLHLMGVKTNATFLAGADRSAPDAPGSPLVNDAADVALLRKAEWARAQPLALCKGGVLVGGAADGVAIGGYPVPMLRRGREMAGLQSGGAWLVWLGKSSVHGRVLDSNESASALLARGVRGESVWLTTPLEGRDVLKQISIDWIGQHGGRTHIADVPRLRGLSITSPDCAALLERMDRLPAGGTLDLSAEFRAKTAPLYPKVTDPVWFDKPGVLAFEREVGWLRPEIWGSFTIGDHATLGFTLPREHCHAQTFDFKVHPFIAPSRPVLDVKVFANGALMTTWRFDKRDTGTTWHHVSATVRSPDAQCRVDLRFEFSRPGALPPPYPEGEDPRPLQLLFLSMEPTAGPPTVAAAQ